jgi:predicted DNA-binding protein (UPF0251 family)
MIEKCGRHAEKALTWISNEHMFKIGGAVGRPEKLRTVGCVARGRAFKPVGRRAADLEVVTLRLDELEALRLADLEGLYQEAGAERMGVSRPTFARILARARSTVARALIEERLLVVGDGPVVTGPAEPLPCPVHGGGPRRGRGCRCRRDRERYQGASDVFQRVTSGGVGDDDNRDSDA